MIAENLKYVNERIQKSCLKAGRDEKEVTLIAVSKTKPVPDLMEAYQEGCREFGENKVQELVDKYEVMPKDIHWHMIGHLQTNKVKYIVDKVTMIHSVDSIKLAREISKEAEPLIRKIALLDGIKICGLMTIAPYVEDEEKNRQYFADLKQLSVDIATKNIDNVNMNVLSMGMTGDYAVAIEEGATYVRVGTGIFGERHYAV